MPKTLRTLCRQLAGLRAHDSRDVIVVPGDAAPHVVGRSYYHTTLSGLTIVRYPSAYGWPTLYHASTRRVEVGADWLSSVLC